MPEGLRNLLYTVAGGTIIAALTFYLFTPSPQREPELYITYNIIPYPWPDYITTALMGRRMRDLLATEEPSKRSEFKQQFDNLFKMLALKENFEGRDGLYLHGIIIHNHTDSTLKDISIEIFEPLFGFVIAFGDELKTVSGRGEFFFPELQPNKHIYVTLFDDSNRPLPFNDLIVLQSGRRQKIKYIFTDAESIILENEEGIPYVDIIAFFTIIGAVIALVMLMLKTLYYFFPSVEVGFLSASRSKYLRKLIRAYDAKQRNSRSSEIDG